MKHLKKTHNQRTLCVLLIIILMAALLAVPGEAASSYEIDLSAVGNGSAGPGWSCSGGTGNGGTGTITFNSAASNNEYIIIKNTASASITRHIVIDASVDNISVIYDGSRINMTYYPASNTYGSLDSNVTINGGTNNAVTYKDIYNFNRSDVTVSRSAAGAVITHRGSGNLTTSITNSGAGTVVAYEGVKNTFKTTLNQNGTGTMRLLGNNTFGASSVNVATSAAMELRLSGANTVTDGYIRVPGTALLTIDSEASTPASPHSESGSLSIRGNSENAIIGSVGGNFDLAANSGQIVINGGTLTVIQNGEGGAAIGGGSGHIGNVEINGGNVTAKAINGAAIGGGAGANGTGNVTINGGTISAEITASVNGNGAGIGGGDGGTGNVTINGGIINVQSVYLGTGGGGAGIGGGRDAPGNITITDALITVNVARGAGIGNGSGNSLGAAGKVSITGGTISAYSTAGAGVGEGENNNRSPVLDICHTADIIAFSNGLYNPISGIIGDGNQGDGYFVNMYYDGGILAVDDRYMFVYAHGDKSLPLRIVPIPYAFTGFSYTTGMTTSRNDNVYLGTLSGGMQQLVQYFTFNPIIYSVRRMNEYFTNVNARVSWQHVVFGAGTGFPVYFPVTEKHVSIDGQPIDGVQDNTVMFPANTLYGKAIPAILGYTAVGHKWGTTPPNGSGTYTPGNPSKTITASDTIYFVYDQAKTDVTISKTVAGSFADRTKPFSFTVALRDAGGTPMSAGTSFTTVGGTGTLTLDANGAAVISLKHGQSITIINVLSACNIQIAETPESGYTTEFTDSGGASGSDDTGFRPVGDAARTFAFKNTRATAPPTGIIEDVRAFTALLLCAALLLAACTTAAFVFKRKRLWAGRD